MKKIDCKIEQLESEMSEMEHQLEQLHLEKAREQNKINKTKEIAETMGESLVLMAENLGQMLGKFIKSHREGSKVV